MCPALSAPGSCGQAVALSSHDTSQSSLEPHRVHKHPSPVTMIDWKRILSEVPISHSTETFAYFVHFLCVFWRRNFFRGYVTGQKSLRGMILVTQHHDHHHGPQQLCSHQARCQEWAPPFPWGVTFYFNEVTFGGGERRLYITKQISPSNQAKIRWTGNSREDRSL